MHIKNLLNLSEIFTPWIRIRIQQLKIMRIWFRNPCGKCSIFNFKKNLILYSSAYIEFFWITSGKNGKRSGVGTPESGGGEATRRGENPEGGRGGAEDDGGNREAGLGGQEGGGGKNRESHPGRII